jgi:hypothetical protein
MSKVKEGTVRYIYQLEAKAKGRQIGAEDKGVRSIWTEVFF